MSRVGEHVIPIDPAPAVPASASLAASPTVPTVYVKWHATATIDGLQLTVTSLEVKQDVEGHEALKGTLRLRASGHETELAFHGETVLRWDGVAAEHGLSHNGGASLAVVTRGNRFGRDSSFGCPILKSTKTTLDSVDDVYDDNGAKVPVQTHD